MHFLVLVALLLLSTHSTASDQNLPSLARGVLKKYCASCHHGDGSEYRLFDVQKHGTLTRDPEDSEVAVIIPGNLENSVLWQAMGVQKRMPPKKLKERPSDAELEIIKEWIVQGAKPFPSYNRNPIKLQNVLEAIRNDLRSASKFDRPFLRYFTITHLHNNPSIQTEDLQIERAAIAFAINSLSWKPTLVMPRSVDIDKTIFAINIKDLDWDTKDTWTKIVRHYPFGLDYSANKDIAIKSLADDINELTNDLVFIRSDWFVANALRPPLYHFLLALPLNAESLEKRIGVNVIENLQSDKAIRAGFPASGVSSQNRLVERHDSPVSRYYWKSYDFKPRTARSNLNRFPLGPRFTGNKNLDQAFSHDGGEMIFGLPNGLQAYFLTDGLGNRIDEGPVDVVHDSLKTSGSPAIVNGLSCMHCHKVGMIPFSDTIRDGHVLLGQAKEKVDRIFPPENIIKEKLQRDSSHFLNAASATIGPFVLADFNAVQAEKWIKENANPTGESARRFLLSDLDALNAACELGLDSPKELSNAIKYSKKLQSLGLLPLSNNHLIKRSDWESIDGISLFQEVARELGIGSPISIR